MMNITSKDNAVVKQVHKLLHGAKYRKRNRAFVTEGLRLCRDVAQGGGEIQLALFTPSFSQQFPEEAAYITSCAKTAYGVSEEIMKYLSDTVTPQGVLCVCSLPGFSALPQKTGQYVILEQVSDPGNVGAIARTAEALGIDGLLLAGGCDAYHPKALRASMGALLRLPVYQGEMDEFLDCMQQLSVPVYAAVAHEYDCAIGEITCSKGCAMVIGNEAAGVTQETLRRCCGRVTIPMAGRAESLNAAMAACILMWEMTGRGGKL